MAEVGKHDGHSDGHLNCVAMRHGWSRSFSLSPDEVGDLCYETLSRALEGHTLNLRPMMLRVFVEHPPASGTWAKIRPFKNDGCLQSVLVRAFFDQRMRDGVVTVMEIRDGADRREEGDMLSLRSVGSHLGSRIFHPKDKSEDKKSGGWFSKLIKRVKSGNPPRASPAGNSHTQLRDIGSDDVYDEEDAREMEVADTHTKPSSSSGGFFSYFFSSAPSQRTLTPPLEVDEEEEEEAMRTRGWLPPGVKRQVSLRHRLSAKSKARKEKPQNPFLGGSKKEDPFTDPEAATVEDEEQGDEESRDVDDFFEMERPEDSGMQLDNVNSKDKAWSRFTPRRNRSKGKGKGKAVSDKASTPSSEQPPSVVPSISDGEY